MIETYVSLFKCLTGSRTLSIVLVYGPLTRAIATLAELAYESLTQAPVQTLTQTLSRWMTKPAIPI